MSQQHIDEICLIWLMYNHKIKDDKFNHSSYLSFIQNFHFYEALKIIMISQNLDRVLTTLKRVTSLFKYLNDDQKFKIMCFVIDLDRHQLSQSVSNRVSQFRYLLRLCVNLSDCLFRYISLYLTLKFWIEMNKNWHCHKDFFKSTKHLLDIIRS